MRAPTEEWYIFDQISAVLRRNGLDHYSPVRELLNTGARVAGDHEFSVLARDNHGDWVTLEHRLGELKADPRYAGLFPNPPRVPRNDIAKLKANFEHIARGDVIAE